MSKRFVAFLDVSLILFCFILGLKIIVTTMVSNIFLLISIGQPRAYAHISFHEDTPVMYTLIDFSLLLFLFIVFFIVLLIHSYHIRKKQNNVSAFMNKKGILSLSLEQYIPLDIGIIAVILMNGYGMWQVLQKKDMFLLLFPILLFFSMGIFIFYQRVLHDIAQKHEYAFTHFV